MWNYACVSMCKKKEKQWYLHSRSSHDSTFNVVWNCYYFPFFKTFWPYISHLMCVCIIHTYAPVHVWACVIYLCADVSIISFVIKNFLRWIIILFFYFLHSSTEEDPSPKAKSYYTILCLDTSNSMTQHGAFDQMKQIVEEFINGQFL